VEVVMKERAMGQAKTSPEVMARFRNCVVVRYVEDFESNVM